MSDEYNKDEIDLSNITITRPKYHIEMDLVGGQYIVVSADYDRRPNLIRRFFQWLFIGTRYKITINDQHK